MDINPARAMWAMGDYDRFARATIWELGPRLVSACGISPGQRVLDVAAGTGNVAIRAAQAGASVVASDVAPEHFESGRRGAAAAGVDIEWCEADAEALPFDDKEFDVVTSCLGAMFAPHHRAVADQLLRVCRPGGTIGLINFTPEGIGGEFFALLGPYAPAPHPDAEPPLLWGDPSHVRDVFGGRVSALEMHRDTYIETAPRLQDYCALFRDTFGPMVAIRAGLVGSPARLEALDRAFLDAVVRWNGGRQDGQIAITYEYLLVVARRTGGH